MIQSFTDKLAIGLSVACTAHCLLLPIALIWLPSIALVHVNPELVHTLMLLLVLPISVGALTMGCLKHKRYQSLLLGFTGLGVLVSAIMLEDILGASGEKWLTLIGGALVAIAHFRNYRQCRLSKEDCDCPDH